MWAVLDYTDTRVISRELLLVKVSVLGPEYLEDQFVGGPSHEARRGSPLSHAPTSTSSSSASKAEREAVLAHNFERSGHPKSAVTEPHVPLPLTASEALRLKHQHLQSISVLANQFGAKIVDVSDNSVIVELTAKTTRVVAFLNLLKPFGILESARTGVYCSLLIRDGLSTWLYRSHGDATYTNCKIKRRCREYLRGGGRGGC